MLDDKKERVGNLGRDGFQESSHSLAGQDGLRGDDGGDAVEIWLGPGLTAGSDRAGSAEGAGEEKGNLGCSR